MNRVVRHVLLIVGAAALSACEPANVGEPLPPLFSAVVSEDVEKVEELLRAGIDPNQRLDGDGYAALSFAVGVHINVSKRQQRKFDGLGGPPDEDTRILELLLKHGADPNGTAPFRRPLHVAIYHGLVRSVRILLANGADPNLISVTSQPPLHKAAHFCYVDIASLLIKHGARVDAVDKAGNDVRGWAIKRECPQVAKLIDQKLQQRN